MREPDPLPFPAAAAAPLALAAAEDEGVVLVVVVEADGTSSLVVLDGSSLRELGRARTDEQVTIGFHGSFVPAAA